VQLGTTMMKTRFGQKARPDFKVVGWRGRQDETGTGTGNGDGNTGKPAQITRANDLNDAVPF
jgi:hypothetical protein